MDEQIRMKPLKVSILKVSAHSWLFGACLAPYDRYKLLLGEGQLDILESASAPVIPFKHTRLAKVWDPNPKRAEQFASAFNCEVAQSPDDAAADVDAVILSETSEYGADHPELAIPILERGIPMFVDKPMADTTENALRIINSAKKGNARVASASLLYYSDAIRRLKQADIGMPLSIVATASGQFASIFHSIHAVSSFAGYFKYGAKSVLAVSRLNGIESIHVEYENETQCMQVYCQLHEKWTDFRLDLYGTKGSATASTPFLDYRYGIIKATANFLRSIADETCAMKPLEMLEPLAVCEAAMISHREQRRVLVSELLDVGQL